LSRIVASLQVELTGRSPDDTPSHDTPHTVWHHDDSRGVVLHMIVLNSESGDVYSVDAPALAGRPLPP